MGVTYNKTNNLKYTELCMYIDAHMSEVTNVGEHPDIEATIFEYLYHIIYALACKKCFFKKFEDYDAYALYAASEIYTSMRKKYERQGQEVRGKIIVPVKSCLNFIKVVMGPLKVNYQQQNFTRIADPRLGHDTEGMLKCVRDSVQADYRDDLTDDYERAIKTMSPYIKKYLARSPFRNDSEMCKKLYISTLLTLLNSISMLAKTRAKLEKNLVNDTSDKITERFSSCYIANIDDAIL